MTRRIRNWLARRWSHRLDPSLAQSYQVAFSGFHGERVLHHLMDSIYCTVYQGTDPVELGTHNGRRSVVHEILENIDLAENPKKYEYQTITEEKTHAA